MGWLFLQNHDKKRQIIGQVGDKHINKMVAWEDLVALTKLEITRHKQYLRRINDPKPTPYIIP